MVLFHIILLFIMHVSVRTFFKIPLLTVLLKIATITLLSYHRCHTNSHIRYKKVSRNI